MLEALEVMLDRVKYTLPAAVREATDATLAPMLSIAAIRIRASWLHCSEDSNQQRWG